MHQLLWSMLLLSSLVWGRNDVPSCYEALKIENPNPSIDKALFILIDQTTPLDKTMMKYTYNNMMRFLKNGYPITIASFSRILMVNIPM
ncbi:MAG: hypothetical protein Q9M36_02660 [Sulfurovum sp.]|nr:hypothetical protein [Sulfurovum sp.]